MPAGTEHWISTYSTIPSHTHSLTHTHTHTGGCKGGLWPPSRTHPVPLASREKLQSESVRYWVGALSGWCAIGLVRDLLCVLSGRVLSGWCAIRNFVNFSCAIGLVQYRTNGTLPP